MTKEEYEGFKEDCLKLKEATYRIILKSLSSFEKINETGLKRYEISMNEKWTLDKLVNEVLPDPLVTYNVTDKHDIVMTKRNGSQYWIEHERLSECDWISHMMTKAWCDMGKFLVVYFRACHLEGIDSINLRIPKDFSILLDV